MAFSSGVSLTCTLLPRCHRLRQQGVDVAECGLFALGPPRHATGDKLVKDDKLVEHRQRDVPERVLEREAVFCDPRRDGKLPRRAGR